MFTPLKMADRARHKHGRHPSRSESDFAFWIRCTFICVLTCIMQGCASQSAKPLGSKTENNSIQAAPFAAEIAGSPYGQPIEGVVVLAYWDLQKPEAMKSPACDVENLQEAVSDPEGTVHLPGWGPISSRCGTLNKRGPLLLIFKPGYAYGDYDSNTPQSSISTTWTPAYGIVPKIELQSLPKGKIDSPTPDSPLMNFMSLNQELITLITTHQNRCYWKKFPDMLRAISAYRRQLDRTSASPVDAVDTFLASQDQWFQQISPQCGSPKKFIEGLGENSL